MTWCTVYALVGTVTSALSGWLLEPVPSGSMVKVA